MASYKTTVIFENDVVRRIERSAYVGLEATMAQILGISEGISDPYARVVLQNGVLGFRYYEKKEGSLGEASSRGI